MSSIDDRFDIQSSRLHCSYYPFLRSKYRWVFKAACLVPKVSLRSSITYAITLSPIPTNFSPFMLNIRQNEHFDLFFFFYWFDALSIFLQSSTGQGSPALDHPDCRSFYPFLLFVFSLIGSLFFLYNFFLVFLFFFILDQYISVRVGRTVYSQHKALFIVVGHNCRLRLQSTVCSIQSTAIAITIFIGAASNIEFV